MATKTTSVDLDAYRRLTRARRGEESFSQVIKRVVPEPFDFEKWLRSVRSSPLGGEAISAIEKHIAGRLSRSRRGG
ncbi:MAG: hypothetical protein IT435_01485 [Phycisphaerales bacterium]|nr:hypothetical protein [Phycisphaerales bacterium]